MAKIKEDIKVNIERFTSNRNQDKYAVFMNNVQLQKARMVPDTITADDKAMLSYWKQHYAFDEVTFAESPSEFPRYNHSQDQLIWNLFDANNVLKQLPVEGGYVFYFKEWITGTDKDQDITFRKITRDDNLLGDLQDFLKKCTNRNSLRSREREGCEVNINVFVLCYYLDKYEDTELFSYSARQLEHQTCYECLPRFAAFKNLKAVAEFIKQLEKSQLAEKNLTGRTWAEWRGAWHLGAISDMNEAIETAISQRAEKKETIPILSFNKYPKGLQERNILDLQKVVSLLGLCKLKKDGDILPTPELALRRAAAAGKIDLIRDLIKNVKDIDINEKGPDSGKTAAIFAQEKGHLEIIKLLQEKGTFEAVLAATPEEAIRKTARPEFHST